MRLALVPLKRLGRMTEWQDLFVQEKVRCAPTPCHLNGWATLKWGVVFVRESEDAQKKKKKCTIGKMDQK